MALAQNEPDRNQVMNKKTKDFFIVWNPFQRRAQTLATKFDLETRYYHFKWEERGKLFKALSYLGKFYLTMRDLLRYRPRYVFIQLAPTPLLYAAALYKLLTGNRYIADCHNTMLYDAWWIKWPFAKRLLRSSCITLVHNDDVRAHADRLGIESKILRDPLPVMAVSDDVATVAGIPLRNTNYVIIPCGMAADEPVRELFGAARAIPEVLFVMTWFADRLPPDLRLQAPENMRFTGFLPEAEFNALYTNARAALVLTTREGTQPSGAAEAISLGVPLVVSELRTTKRLYGDAPVFVRNEPEAIASGVRMALVNHDSLARAIADLRQGLVEDAASQIEAIKRLMVE